MKRNKLDKIDRKILRDLQTDGRITNVELAKNAGISAPPCLRRVRALEDSGYIKGYHADVDAKKMGYGVMAYAHVCMNTHGDAEMKAFQDALQDWDEVREAHMISGEVDFLLKIVAPDWDAYQEFLTRKLMGAVNVASVKTSLAIRTVKNLAGVPIEVD